MKFSVAALTSKQGIGTEDLCNAYVSWLLKLS